MTLTHIGWYVTVAGLLLGFLATVLSLIWHKIDNAAHQHMAKAKEAWSKGDKVEGSKWHDKVNSALQIGYKIRSVGVFVLYTSAILTLFGWLCLAIGSRP